MATRAERIAEILQESPGNRMRTREIARELARREGFTEEADKLVPLVTATVAQDNRNRRKKGRAPLFNRFGEQTEERGYISLRKSTLSKRKKEALLKNAEETLASLIEESNARVKKKVKKAMAKLSWRDFETRFLTMVMEALGFHSIEVTQSTRDGGKDAECFYSKGIIKGRAIISAKHWNSGRKVGVDEVQRMRGIKGKADTAVIFTSASFTEAAKKEAAPTEGLRSVVLLDGDAIAEACLESELLGVKQAELPKFYKFNEVEELEGCEEL